MISDLAYRQNKGRCPRWLISSSLRCVTTHAGSCNKVAPFCYACPATQMVSMGHIHWLNPPAFDTLSPVCSIVFECYVQLSAYDVSKLEIGPETVGIKNCNNHTTMFKTFVWDLIAFFATSGMDVCCLWFRHCLDKHRSKLNLRLFLTATLIGWCNSGWIYPCSLLHNMFYLKSIETVEIQLTNKRAHSLDRNKWFVFEILLYHPFHWWRDL